MQMMKVAKPPSAIHLTTNNFVAEESELIKNGLPPDLANAIYEEGGFLVITDLPKGIEVGIDYRTFIATDKFLGFKVRVIFILKLIYLR